MDDDGTAYPPYLRIGLATAKVLSERGARVALIARTRSRLDAAVAAVAFVVMWPLTKGPAERVADQLDATAEIVALSGGSKKRLSFAAVLLSGFGLFLLINFLSQFGEQLVESQYPNYLNDVFKIEPETAALAMALAVLISAPLYPLSGRWAAKSGPKLPFMVSIAMRTLTVGGLAFISINIGDASQGVQTLALVLFGLMIVVYPFFEVNTSLIAAKTSPVGPGGGQGFQGGATQLAGIMGGFTAGWLANQAGYQTTAASRSRYAGSDRSCDC